MKRLVKGSDLQGTIHIPSSKSDGQRALLCAALSKGRSILNQLGSSDDELAMLRNIQVIGAKVEEKDDGSLMIAGIHTFPEYLELNVGESGLGLRLLAGICATQKGNHRIAGVGSILKRDQSFFEDNLNKYGAEVISNQGKLPLEFGGQIKVDKLDVDGSLSSQYISGLLLGLALNVNSSTLNVHDLKSGPYVDMTMNTMSQFGVKVQNNNYKAFQLNGEDSFLGTNYMVESDWSSASYWLAAAALGCDVKIKGLDLKSKQADVKFLEALELAGCSVLETENGLEVKTSVLNGFEFDATNCPDLFPALVVVASKCNGLTKIQGLSRLANKESDRGVVLQQEFGKLGVEIKLDEDYMLIQGNSQLKRAKVSSNHDHRIAMSLAILGTTIVDGIEIEHAEAVSKSYPEFWQHLDELSVS